MSVVFSAPVRFDSYGLPPVRKDLEKLMSSGQDVTIDMSRVETFDGAGVGALATVFKRIVRAEGQLRIVNVPVAVSALLGKCGALDLLSAPRVRGELAPVSSAPVAAVVLVAPKADTASDAERRDAA